MVSCECTLKSFRTFDNNEWILKPELFVSFFPPRFSFIVEIKIVITVEIIVEIKIIFTKKQKCCIQYQSQPVLFGSLKGEPLCPASTVVMNALWNRRSTRQVIDVFCSLGIDVRCSSSSSTKWKSSIQFNETSFSMKKVKFLQKRHLCGFCWLLCTRVLSRFKVAQKVCTSTLTPCPSGAQHQSIKEAPCRVKLSKVLMLSRV